MKPLHRSFWLIVALCGLIAMLADTAVAQTRTTTGGTGSSGLGGGIGGISGSNSFGGGQNRFSATNANTASASQSVFMNQQSSFGLQGQSQQNEMVGSRNTQQFLGANQRNAQSAQQQQQNQFGNRNNRGRQNQMDPNDPNGMMQQGQDQDSRRSIRPQQKVAFEIPERTSTEIQEILDSRFERVTRQPALRGVTVELDYEGVVVLRGEVLTSSQMRLAANMVRLEPGVKKIRNELTLAQPADKN